MSDKNARQYMIRSSHNSKEKMNKSGNTLQNTQRAPKRVQDVLASIKKRTGATISTRMYNSLPTSLQHKLDIYEMQSEKLETRYQNIIKDEDKTELQFLIDKRNALSQKSVEDIINENPNALVSLIQLKDPHKEDFKSEFNNTREFKEYITKRYNINVKVQNGIEINPYIMSETAKWLEELYMVTGGNIMFSLEFDRDFFKSEKDTYGYYDHGVITLPTGKQWEKFTEINVMDVGNTTPFFAFKTPRGLLWHEYGHFLFHYLRIKTRNDWVFDKIEKKEVIDRDWLKNLYNNEIDGIDREEWNNLSIYTELSSYFEGEEERFAETIASIMTGERIEYIPPDIAEKFKEIIVKYMKLSLKRF